MATTPKIALITGSTSGIGLEIAKGLAVQGHSIMLNSHIVNQYELELCKQLAEDTGSEVRICRADLSKVPEAIHLVNRCVAELGGLDILVNNAGVQYVAETASMPLEMWDKVIAVNLTACFITIRYSLPYMLAKRWGRIVNIASVHGLVASKFKAPYVAAKHGVIGLTKAVAVEVADQGVTCNAVCPGYVLTPLVEQQVRDQAKVHKLRVEEVAAQVFLAEQPNKKFVTVEEVARMVTLLCEDVMGSTTGAAMVLDGGWTAK